MIFLVLGVLLTAAGAVWVAGWPPGPESPTFPIGTPRFVNPGPETSHQIRDLKEEPKAYRLSPASDLNLARLSWPFGKPVRGTPTSRAQVCGKGLAATLLRVDAEAAGSQIVVGAAVMPRAFRFLPLAMGAGFLALGANPRVGLWIVVVGAFVFLALGIQAWRLARRTAALELDRIEDAFRK